MEGVAFAPRRNLAILESQSGRVERIVVSGGGARTRLWLEIKASIYDRPILVPKEAEAGVIGCAMIAALAGGAAGDWSAARSRFVGFAPEVPPRPEWRDRYARLGEVFEALYRSGRELWDALDRLHA